MNDGADISYNQIKASQTELHKNSGMAGFPEYSQT
jgi:hypothetical protein